MRKEERRGSTDGVTHVAKAVYSLQGSSLNGRGEVVSLWACGGNWEREPFRWMTTWEEEREVYSIGWNRKEHILTHDSKHGRFSFMTSTIQVGTGWIFDYTYLPSCIKILFLDLYVSFVVFEVSLTERVCVSGCSRYKFYNKFYNKLPTSLNSILVPIISQYLNSSFNLTRWARAFGLQGKRARKGHFGITV